MSVTFHLFDAIGQDEETVDEKTNEVKYITSSDEDDDDEVHHVPRKKTTSKNGLAKNREYVIHLFGTTPDGKTVRLTVKNFEPFFFVRIPEGAKMFANFKTQVLAAFKRRHVNMDHVSITACKKKILYTYTGGKDFSFAEIKVKSRKTWYEARKLFLDQEMRPSYTPFAGGDPLKVYDANLDPMLRFFHLRKLQPCGWVKAIVDLELEDGVLTGACDWEDIEQELKPPMASAPFLTNFWDIECYSESGDFPLAEKDPIIQIGNVLVRQGSPPEKHIFVLGECAPVPGAVMTWYRTEKEMLNAWAKFMESTNPDILVGYNIFGFDEKYVWDRAKVLKLTTTPGFQSFNRLSSLGQVTKLEEKFLSSAAMGDNYLYMWTTTGRLQIDLLHYIRRNNTLGSYKLDSVCQYFLSGKLSSVDTSVSGQWFLKTKQTGDAAIGRSVVLLDETGEALVDKMKIIKVEPGKGLYVEVPDDDEKEGIAEAVKWAIVKDDVSPAEIFKFHRGSATDRAKVAAYCIQDCDLVYELYKKLDVFNNAMSMANVCSVPVNYIFTRGQGIKIESLIYKECYERDLVIEVLESPNQNGSEESYEGAIVLDPEPGFYSESPIGVCDFASLYPSTIISEDISYDSLVWVKDFDFAGKSKVVFGSINDENNAPPGTRWTNIEFDIWKSDPEDTRKHPAKMKTGVRVCRYAQKADGSKHTLPDIVAKLLATRKSKRKEAEKEQDPFKKALLDAEQLAYKLTANSLYGQLGSGMFKIRLQHLAASVTAYGRKQILFAKAAIEQFYGPEAKDPRCSAKVIYGDTDSLFVDFGVKDASGNLLKGTEAIQATIDITEEAGKFVSAALKSPHDFEYDKVFDQFIIFSKKRYVGNKYEESATEFKQTSMGTVLKRRDNAPILKTIYGGAIRILLNEKDVPKAVEFVKQKCNDMIDGKMSLSQLTITKSLSANYKSVPAHKILADRMKERDPGNAPASGERMGFIYICAPAGAQAPKLQGDRIESPDYIKAKGLLPDYQYYIKHQLENPLGQLFGIMLEKIPGYQYKGDLEDSERVDEAIQLLFGKALGKCDMLAKRAFVAKQFGGNIVVNEPVRKVQVVQAPVVSSSIQKQVPIDSYFITKMIVKEYNDQQKALKKEKEKDKKK